ncbi:hypothetical protein CASFOL_001015 [Castilleja foliolosa]|uniref:Uncharacterized protein n=1 Tax=Castilleja foliolosa TaxID=1961234 RepID=A0ABD3ELY3_9LAMI
MKFSVTRISRGLVAPSGPTPSGVLELSAIDKLPVLRGNVQTLHVYKHGPGAANVIRQALSKALVSYYPLAGRLRFSDHNRELIQVACSGDGVWFVEALADCTLDDVAYFDDAMSIPYDELLPVRPQENDGLDPLVQMQVTQFGCNGFVVGLTFCHTICDGLGAAQFLNAVGELARGAEQPSISPEWCRNFLPQRPTLPLRPISIPDYQLEPATIDLSLDKIKELKQDFRKQSGGGTCSTFEIVAAVLWRERTRAIEPQQDKMKLVFFANVRQLIQKPAPLPKGFYGNCFFPVSVTVSRDILTKDEEDEETGLSGVFQVVKLIQEAKAGLASEFLKWLMMDDVEVEEGDPFRPELEYGTLFMSEWDRLGFKEVDYGWGKPVHIVPIQGSSVMPVGLVCSPPAPASGIRMRTWCVQQHHTERLLRSMDRL